MGSLSNNNLTAYSDCVQHVGALKLISVASETTLSIRAILTVLFQSVNTGFHVITRKTNPTLERNAVEFSSEFARTNQ